MALKQLETFIHIYMRSVFSSVTQTSHFLIDFFFILVDDDDIGSYYIFKNPFIRYIKISFCSSNDNDAFSMESNLLNGISDIWIFSIVFFVHIWSQNTIIKQFHCSDAYS